MVAIISKGAFLAKNFWNCMPQDGVLEIQRIML